MSAAWSIMDNKSGESSDWDLPILKDILAELDTGDIDMNITGFDVNEIGAFMTQIHLLEKNDDTEGGSNYYNNIGKGTAFFGVGEVGAVVGYELLKAAEARLREMIDDGQPEIEVLTSLLLFIRDEWQR